MLNAEKYKDEIVKVGYDFALFANKPIVACHSDEYECDTCKFHNDFTGCRAKRIKWLLEEYKEPILSDEEKKILLDIINAIKPFTDVKPLILRGIRDTTGSNIVLCYGDEDICLPTFKDTMFEKLEKDNPYGLEELGLC